MKRPSAGTAVRVDTWASTILLRCDAGHGEERNRQGGVCGLPVLVECSQQRLASTTFVAIRTFAVTSLLKTSVATHTVEGVSMCWECRFVW